MSTYSTSEVGHAKNVANFSDLISYCEGFGSSYNPSNGIITIIELRDLHERAENALQNVYNT